MQLLLSGTLTVLVTAATAFSAEPNWWEANAKLPVPDGAKVHLQLDRTEYFLGENVLVHFTLENVGDKPFEVSFGGDYRGATRARRFQVTATDETGRSADDPDPSEFHGGGFGGSREMHPGERFTQSLPLMYYCRIDNPGRYTIRVTHDYGWKEGERKRPAGEVTLTFRMPTVAEAEAVVAKVQQLPKSPDNTYGQRAREYGNYSLLRQPVYLQPLIRQVQEGNLDALQGICWIATPEATEALIELCKSNDPKLALDSARTLTMRLPHPTLQETNGFEGFPPFTRTARRHLAQHSWTNTLGPAVRALATNLMTSSQSELVNAGAVMIQAVGTPAEGPAVKDALDHAVDWIGRPRRNRDDNILNQPESVRDLLTAALALEKRGYDLTSQGISKGGGFLIYFSRFAGSPLPRPQDWLEILNVFGENGKFPIRVAALDSIPDPVPAECLPFVRSRLADPDLGVCRAACQVAGRSKHTEFIEPLLEIIATEHHEWLLREATDAATKLGAGFDLLETWAERLNDEHLYGLALDSLQTVVEGLPGSSAGRTDLPRGERIALRRAWREFLLENGEALRAGKKFKPEDPALKPALFGRARTWQLPNGKMWPLSYADMNKHQQP